jgi:hypothetical protein
VWSYQLLEDDLTKRAIYTDAHTSCMVPRWRDMAAIITTKTALIEVPPPESLNVWAAEVDWAKIYTGTLMIPFYDMVVFADAWAAIEQRWADGDYSVRAWHYSVRHPLTCGFYFFAGDAAGCSQPSLGRGDDHLDHDGQGDGEGARTAGRVGWSVHRCDAGRCLASYPSGRG